MKQVLPYLSLALLSFTTFPQIAAQATSLSPTAATRPAALTITGRILNEKSVPLPGVVVALKGGASSATTNSSGAFLLTVVDPNPVLIVKCAGYQTQTLVVKAAGPLSITLQPIGAAAAASTTGLEVVGGLLNLADEQPAFPGGVEAYRTFLQKNVHFPDEAKAKNMSGDVFVSFVVDEAGRILDAEVAKGFGFGFDEEALRLVRLMPWWTPGRQAGKPVRVPCTLRIRFGLQQQPQPQQP